MDDIAAASALAGRLQASIFTLRLQLQQEATTATIVEEAVQSAAESAAVLSNYIRLLGRPARGHTMTASDVDLNKLAVAAGLADRLSIRVARAEEADPGHAPLVLLDPPRAGARAFCEAVACSSAHRVLYVS